MKTLSNVIAMSCCAVMFLSGRDAKGQQSAGASQGQSGHYSSIDDAMGGLGLLRGKASRAGFDHSREAPLVPGRSNITGLGTLRRVPQQYPTIQSGINASIHGDTVLVSEGTYLENIKYGGKRIIVASLYLLDQDTLHVSRTIIDGRQPVHLDSGSTVSFVSGEDTNSVLCGFTVRGGFGTYIPFWNESEGGGVFLWESGARLVRNIITGNHIEAPNAWGGGVSIAGFANVGQTLIMEQNRVSRNIVTGYTGVGFGGGVSVYQSQFRLIDNFFEDDTSRGVQQAGASGVVILLTTTNQPAGIIQGNVFRSSVALGDSFAGACLSLLTTEAVVVDGNTFEDNIATSIYSGTYGGAIYVGENSATAPEKHITGNVIRRNRVASVLGNTFGAAVNIWTSRARIAKNLIEDNTSQAGMSAYGGGFYGVSWGGTIENNIFAGNTGTYGGGIGHSGAPPPGVTQAIVNNTVSNNIAALGGGFYGGDNTASILLNNIFWGDTSSTGEIYATGSVEAHYSNIEGGWTGGAGNIDINPMFADTLYRLANTSPCIGVGKDSVQILGVWYRAPTRDFSGNSMPMPAGSQPDMGASENPRGVPTSVGDGGSGLPAVFELAQNYPNPFNPSTEIGFQIADYGLVALKVFDLLGREVATLVNEEKQPGTYTVQWGANGAASGVYYYRLRAGSVVETKKMLLLR